MLHRAMREAGFHEAHPLGEGDIDAGLRSGHVVRSAPLNLENLTIGHVEKVDHLSVLGPVIQVVLQCVDHVQDHDGERAFRDASPGLS